MDREIPVTRHAIDHLRQIIPTQYQPILNQFRQPTRMPSGNDSRNRKSMKTADGV